MSKKNKKFLDGITDKAVTATQEELNNMIEKEDRFEFLLDVLKNTPRFLTIENMQELFLSGMVNTQTRKTILPLYIKESKRGDILWLTENIEEYSWRK